MQFINLQDISNKYLLLEGHSSDRTVAKNIWRTQRLFNHRSFMIAQIPYVMLSYNEMFCWDFNFLLFYHDIYQRSADGHGMILLHGRRVIVLKIHFLSEGISYQKCACVTKNSLIVIFSTENAKFNEKWMGEIQAKYEFLDCLCNILARIHSTHAKTKMAPLERKSIAKMPIKFSQNIA